MKLTWQPVWKATAAFGVALALLLVVGAVFYRSNVALVRAEVWVTHTHEVLATLAQVLSAETEAESAGRAYFISPTSVILSRYEISAAATSARLAQLQRLTVDDAPQSRRLYVLDGLIRRRLRLLADLVSSQPSAPLAVGLQVARTMEADLLQASVRELVADIVDAEELLLHSRSIRATVSMRRNLSTIISGTGLALCLMGAGFYLLQRETTQRMRAEDALLSSTERLRMAVEAAGMGTWFWDVEKDAISWSAQFRAIFGLTSDATLTYEAILQVIHPDDRQRLDQNIRNTLERGVPYDLEYRVIWPDSSVHWVAAKGRARRSPEGLALDMQGIAMDVTERKDAQQALKERSELERSALDLKRSNNDLQQFAYIAAHDLQEPLRMVASYTQLLAKRYKGRLDADADTFIAFAVDGAHRMQVLIGDLLKYCRVGTTEHTLRAASSADVLERALLNLRGAIQDCGAVITHDPLPTVVADGGQLVLLFQNLVANAMKYRSGEPPRVHVSAGRNGANEWVFSIRDNGIGIDPQYFEKIFVMFQRLHGREEFAGTGIGLPVCKKIAERHGGRMWVESARGKGSTFYFALPERT